MKFIKDYFAARAAKKEQERIAKLSYELVDVVRDSARSHVEPKLALEMVKTLVAEGADPTACNHKAIQAASYHKMNDIFNVLAKPVTDQAILHEIFLDSIRTNNTAIFETVIGKISDVKTDKDAALKLAVEINNTDALQKLAPFYPVELNNDTSPKNIAFWAIAQDNNRAFGAIRVHNKFSPEQTSEFLEHAQNCNAKIIVGILEKEKHKNDIPSRMLVEFMTAPAEKFAEAHTTRLQEAEVTLKEGADPTYNKSEALAYASYYGHKDCVRHLLAAGAKPGDDDNRAIRWARSQNNEAIALMLERHLSRESQPAPVVASASIKSPKIA